VLICSKKPSPYKTKLHVLKNTAALPSGFGHFKVGLLARSQCASKRSCNRQIQTSFSVVLLSLRVNAELFVFKSVFSLMMDYVIETCSVLWEYVVVFDWWCDVVSINC
jgi:hypothetical protein